MKEHNPDKFLQKSEYCDFDDESIRVLSSRIISGLTTDQEKAVAIFNWVRDNILYRVGLWQKSASGTLREKKGTCTNKANLLVALLRSIGIPAGYGVLRTKGQEYIGPVVVPILRKRIRSVSTHVYAYVYLRERWIKCDPSADLQLSQNTVMINPQSRLVVWDGEHDATEDLDENHILSEKGPIANIDDIIKKKSKNGRGVIIKVANLYVEFLRECNIQGKDIHELEEAFLSWLSQEKHSYFLVIYFRTVTWYKDRTTRLGDHFWSKYMSVYDVMDRAAPYKELINNILRSGKFEKNQLVLDAGSGTGLISIAIKKSGARVISVDNSHTAMALHKKKDVEAEFVVSDLRHKLPFSNDYFDRVVCILTLHVLSPHDREAVITEFFRVLKPGGIVVLVNPSVHFNSFRIFTEHVRSAFKTLGWWKAIYEIFLFVIPITKMFYYNFILEFGGNSYNYLELNEQCTYLKEAGFGSVSETKEIYAHSAVLNWAIK